MIRLYGVVPTQLLWWQWKSAVKGHPFAACLYQGEEGRIRLVKIHPNSFPFSVYACVWGEKFIHVHINAHIHNLNKLVLLQNGKEARGGEKQRTCYCYFYLQVTPPISTDGALDGAGGDWDNPCWTGEESICCRDTGVATSLPESLTGGEETDWSFALLLY